MNNNHYYVFIDVDGTLIKLTTLRSFLTYYVKNNMNNRSLNFRFKYWFVTFQLKVLSFLKFKRELLNKIYYTFYRNENVQLIEDMGIRWFTELQAQSSIFEEKIIDSIQFHKNNNATIVLLSGSFPPCLKPIAKALSISEMICTNLETINNYYTGKIVEPQIIGNGKAEGIKHYLKGKQFSDYSCCYAYVDHISDLPVLELVGNPCVINADQHLLDLAKSQNWCVL